MSRADHQLKIRMPEAERKFLTAAAAQNGSSINFEVVRAVKERMARQKAEGASAPTPAPSNAT